MPVKLERKLKRQAAADPSIKDKDAYVYGTLRKTGWKPSREKRASKKMSDTRELVRLDKMLDGILSFQYAYPDEQRKDDSLKTAGTLAAGAGLGYGGLKAYQYLKGQGGGSAAAGAGKVGQQAWQGLGKNLEGLKTGYKMARSPLGAQVSKPIVSEGGELLRAGSNLGYRTGAKVGGAVSSLLRSIGKLEDPRKLTEFQATGYNPDIAKQKAGFTTAGSHSYFGGKTGGSGAIGNTSRALANTPKAAGQAVEGGLSKTAGATNYLKKFFQPAMAARLGAYMESKEQPQIFKSAEDTLEFQGEEIPQVGKSLERLRGILKEAGSPGWKSQFDRPGDPGFLRSPRASRGARMYYQQKSGERFKDIQSSKGVLGAPRAPILSGKTTLQPWQGGQAYGGRYTLSATDDTIRFDEHILEPWQGVMSKSKIAQEQFPAGLSPAAALRFPLPKLMELLKARRPQLLQQQFPGFASRTKRLIELGKKLDAVIQFAASDFDDQRRSAGDHKTWKGAGLIAAGGGIGTAGVLGHHEVMKRYGRQGTLPMHAGPPSPGFQNELYWGKIHNPSAIGPSEVGAGKAYRAAATDIKERAATRLRRATRAGKFVYGRHAEGAGLLGRAGAALHGGEAFLKHLNSNLDNIIQFGIKKN